MQPTSLETETHELMSNLLLDVPIFRQQAPPTEFLSALWRASQFTPVFPNWPTPVIGWLNEGEALSRKLGDESAWLDFGIRRAVVAIRQRDEAGALGQLAALPLQNAHPDQVAWVQITRARVHIRQQQTDEAAVQLANVQRDSLSAWTSALAQVARGELALERGQYDEADTAFILADEALPPEWMEERIAVAQSRGFIAITRADAPAASHHLDRARQMLRGAGAWPEVIQMDAAVGSFRLAAGDRAGAEALFEEGLTLCEQYPQPEMETLLRLGLARLRAAEGKADDAVDATAGAATLYAQQGSVLGYLSMILFIARLYREDERYDAMYRTLTTGIGIARHKGWALAEPIFRRQINDLRENVLGAARFDAMVQAMIDAMKGK